MYLSRHVSALAMDHHQVYTNVITVLCVDLMMAHKHVVWINTYLHHFSCVIDLPIPIPRETRGMLQGIGTAGRSF
jgi:hypothetical protein